MSYADAFETAADNISAQDKLWDGMNAEEKRHCTWTVLTTVPELHDLMGVHSMSTIEMAEKDRLRGYILAAIKELYPDFEFENTRYPIFDWNDRAGRTVAESAAVLRKAAELARA